MKFTKQINKLLSQAMERFSPDRELAVRIRYMSVADMQIKLRNEPFKEY
jgi:hypothetical protein